MAEGSFASMVSKRRLTRRASLMVSCLLAASALAGCSTVSSLGERAGQLWPFGREEATERARPDDNRIAVMAAGASLQVDEASAVIPVVVPAPRAQVDWPFAGGNAANAPQSLQGDGVDGLQVAWRRNVASGSRNRRVLIAPPIVGDGRIYVFGTDLVVHAIDTANGRPLWRQSVSSVTSRTRWLTRDATPFAGGLAFNDGKVFAAHGVGEMVALDAASGSVSWRTATQTPLHSSPMVADGRVFVTSYDSEIYAFDANAGTLSWTSSAIPEPARMLTSPSPAVVGETVVAPFASGEVIAMTAGNGRRLWLEGLTRGGAMTSLASINDIASRPVVVDGTVYAASQSGVLAAIDLRSGIRLWDLPVSSIQMPWVAGDYLFIVTVDAELVCVDRRTGKVRWLQQLDRYENPAKRKDRITWAGPVLVDGQLVLASSTGQAIAVNPADGAETSRVNLGAPVYVAPAVANGTIYFLTDRGGIVAVR